MKRYIRERLPMVNYKLLKRSPFLFVYSCYLTWRYFDEYTKFPAIDFFGFVNIKFVKHKTSKLTCNSTLIIEKWLNGVAPIVVRLSQNAKLTIDGEFILGPGVTLFVASNAWLDIKGKKKESGSGITAKSIVMVNKYLQIGYDCLIAWDTYLTDSDWHFVKGKENTKQTIIKDHCWLGVGVKVLKGTTIGENCVVTSNTVVISGEYPPSSLLYGNPLQVKSGGAPVWGRDMVS